MQLDPLEFQVQTEQLDAAITKLGTLQTAVQKLSKDTSSQSDLQVAKETNKVLIENAKAQASLIAIETKRIENQKKLQKAQEETGKASEASGEKSKDKIEEIITKLQLLEKYMGQGFTRGFAGTMSQVEMLGGATAVQMDKITTAMTDLGKHMRNPFDDAIGPIQSINRELEKVHSRGRLAAEGIELTKKQLDEFSRITSSIESQQKSRGLNLLDASSITETTALIKKAQDDYVAKAREFNSSIQKETVIGKAIPATEGNAATALFIKDQENKVKALARAEEMLARLDNKIKQSTAETPLAQSAANQLFTYTKMLEKAGVAADVAKVKIDEFSKKQHAASALALADEEKKIKHLAASLAPQVTDVTVGLMTGQNPLTVFMQQGGQIRDQIGLSRVATEDLGKVFKLTIMGMIDMVMAMGAAMIKFMATPMGIVLSVIAATAAVVTFLSGEMMKSEKQTVELTKALVGSGNAAGTSANEMKVMAKQASDLSGISFDKSIGAMVELAKTGEVSKEEFVQAAEAALIYERYMGVAVADSAKALKELAKDPLKAVMKITEESSYFTAEIIRQVAELERLGLKEEAGALAKAEYSKATKKAAEEVRESMGYLLSFMDKVGLAATKMWDNIKGYGSTKTLESQIEATTANLQALGRAQNQQDSLGGSKTNRMNYSSEITKEANELSRLINLQDETQQKAASQQKATASSKDMSEYQAMINANTIKSETKQQKINRLNVISAGDIAIAAGKGFEEAQAAIAQRDKLIHDINTGKKGDPKAKADTLSSLNLNLDNQTQQDEKQYQLKLRGIDNFTKQEQTRLQNSLTAKEITQGEFMVRELAMIAEGEQKKTTEIKTQQDTRLADYIRDVSKISTVYAEWVDANKGLAGFQDKNKDELEKARLKVVDLSNAYDTSVVAMGEAIDKSKDLSKTLYDKQYSVMAGAIRSAKEELVKFGIAEAKLTQQRKAQVEVEDKLRYATPEQAAYIQAEATETARLTSEVQKYNEELRLQAESLDGANAAKEEEIRLNGFLSLETKKLIDLQQDLYNVKLKNRDVIAGGIDIAGVTAGTAAVVKLQKDKLKELSDGVANSIEIGLFEGGEAGAKSLRNLVEAELRKPITIFIRAVVGDMVNAVSGFVTGGSSSTGGTGSSMMSGLSTASTAKNAYSIYNGGYTAGYTSFATSSAGQALGLGNAATEGFTYGAGEGFAGASVAGEAAGTTALGEAIGTAIPYIGAFVGAVMILSQAGPTSSRTLGSSKASYTDGKLTGTEALDGLIFRPSETIQADIVKEIANPTPWQFDSNKRGSQETPMVSLERELTRTLSLEKQNKSADTGAKGFADLYFNLAKTLDIKTKDAAFSYATNTGQSGEHPNVSFGVEIGGKKYNSGEAAFADPEVVKLAASKTMLEALRSSELPTYLAGVFDDLTTSTATQEQIDTVINLAKSYKSFHDTLQLLPFENLKDMSYATAKALTEAAGGMEAFGAKLESYYSNYYTAEEQKAQTIKNINTTLIGTGFDAATATRDTFRKLVESQDVTTESGRKTYTVLMNVSEAFAGITPAVENATASLKDLLDVVTKAASSAFDVLKKSVELEKTKATELYTEKLAAYNLALTSTNDSISKLTSLAGTLKSTLSSLNIINSDEQQRTTAQASIRAALLQAQSGGGLPLNNELTTALSTITKPSEWMFRTFTEYARDFYKTSADIQALSDLTGTQLSIEEQNLAAVKQQITTLEANHISELAKYDAILTLAQSQLDAANGINASVLSIADALLALSVSISGLVSTRASQGLPTSSVGNISTSTTGTSVYMPVTDSAAQALRDSYQSGGSAFASAQAEEDAKNAALAAMRAGMASFDVGTNYVPSDMIAQIHEGEAIIPKAYNPDANGTNAALVEELRALRVQVADLQASNRETAQSTRNTDKTLVNVTRGGEAMLTQTT